MILSNHATRRNFFDHQLFVLDADNVGQHFSVLYLEWSHGFPGFAVGWAVRRATGERGKNKGLWEDPEPPPPRSLALTRLLFSLAASGTGYPGLYCQNQAKVFAHSHPALWKVNDK